MKILKVILYGLGAAGVLGITYGFFIAIEWVNTLIGGFSILLYPERIWVMSIVLAGLVLFSALAEGRARLEMLSSASFLIYVLASYIIGSSLLTGFIPFQGLGLMQLELATDLSGLSLPISIGSIVVGLNTVSIIATIIIVAGQGLKFLTTFFKSMREFKDEGNVD